jgi:hypothetical protein
MSDTAKQRRTKACSIHSEHTAPPHPKALFRAFFVIIFSSCNPSMGDAKLTSQLRDHGGGIPADALARMGQHFFRACTHQQLAGHDIGLARVRAIARLHQGSITWQLASPGLATTLQLPQPSAPEQTAAEIRAYSA